MSYERRTILSLIAAGRITTAEAERLIAAAEDAREWLWIALGCIAVCLLQSHPHVDFGALGSLLHTVVGHGTKLLHGAASFGFKKMGGMV